MTKPKRPRDLNQLAKLIVGIATGDVAERDPDEGKNPNAIAASRKGGLKGGVARKAALSPERRKAIAEAAARKRWSK